MGWWSFLVKELKIIPSEAWQLDYVELATLAGIKQEAKQDASFMVNAIRIGNGCPQSKLRNLIGSDK